MRDGGAPNPPPGGPATDRGRGEPGEEENGWSR